MREEPGVTSLKIGEGLVEAIFRSRPNRFILHCELPGGSVEKVHLPDPGRLKGILVPGRSIWLLPAKDPSRKTKWSAVMVRDPDSGTYISLNTQLPNRLIREAFMNGELDEFTDWVFDRTEYRIGHSRYDFLLRHKERDASLLVEVKSVTMSDGREGRFPDAVTARGARHVEELAALQGEYETAVLFVAQRGDIDSITSAPEIDPYFAKVMEEAAQKGVQFYGRVCEVTPTRLTLGRKIPVDTSI
ncbi:DNA/RNA nuclease SfsA [Rossellomorea marisflavi]|uniref:DNA/RNA nuclease SfsA n=1 Tax=Rossellomorea marisflavi TaxID=189381 RepID=UPI0025B09990|nr:DNA/RNA nuclease SfsA [Rossellomorea marisflavi]WJV18677.1 DNA/RNA nuclease SfsA [Rossellomorea marisflavi]